MTCTTLTVKAQPPSMQIRSMSFASGNTRFSAPCEQELDDISNIYEGVYVEFVAANYTGLATTRLTINYQVDGATQSIEVDVHQSLNGTFGIYAAHNTRKYVKGVYDTLRCSARVL